MQCVYEPVDLFQAELLFGMLRNEGISAHLVGADLVGGMGELPALGLLRLMVPDQQAEKAQQMIEHYLSATPCIDDELDEQLALSQPGSLLC